MGKIYRYLSRLESKFVIWGINEFCTPINELESPYQRNYNEI